MTSDYLVTELRMPTPWGHIAAKAWGFPNDKHVLAVHGVLDNAGTFDRLIPLLPRGYYFVCIDLPGHGFSSHFPAGGALNYFDNISAVHRVLDHLKWKKCIYMGHSSGGLLGLFYSAAYPTTIEKLICLDANFLIVVNNEQLIDQIRYTQDYTLKTESRVEERLYTREEVIYSLMYLRICTLNVAAAESLMERCVTKVGDKYKWNHDPRLNNVVRPFLDYGQNFEIGQHLTTPTLAILSTGSVSIFKSHQVIDISSELALLNKETKLVTVEGNHYVHSNHPERIVPHISQYLSNVQSNL